MIYEEGEERVGWLPKPASARFGQTTRCRPWNPWVTPAQVETRLRSDHRDNQDSSLIIYGDTDADRRTDNASKVLSWGREMGGGGVIADSNHSLIGLIHCGKINPSCDL